MAHFNDGGSVPSGRSFEEELKFIHEDETQQGKFIFGRLVPGWVESCLS